MLSTEFYLVFMIVAIVVFGVSWDSLLDKLPVSNRIESHFFDSHCIAQGGLYFLCMELEAREKKKFRHTSAIARENEAMEVKVLNGNGGDAATAKAGDAGQKPRKGVKGESFYRGKDTLLKDKDVEEPNNPDFLGYVIYGLPEDDEEEFHLGKSHVLS